MADFEDWDLDGGANGAGQAYGADGATPQVRGGLLDPSTFLSPKSDQSGDAAPPAGSTAADDDWLNPPAPPPGSPDSQVHADVLNDVRQAQAALPPSAAAPASRGLRHIDEYPAMNYAPPGRFPAPTMQSLHDFMSGKPVDFGPHITFRNDTAGGPSTDRPVQNSLARMVEHAVVDSGFNSVNINSSVRPPSGTRSNHPPGYAVDINNIDGFRVIERPDMALRLQDAFALQPEINENFGPGYQVKTLVPGQAPVSWPNVEKGHQDHDHFSARR